MTENEKTNFEATIRNWTEAQLFEKFGRIRYFFSPADLWMSDILLNEIDKRLGRGEYRI